MTEYITEAADLSTLLPLITKQNPDLAKIYRKRILTLIDAHTRQLVYECRIYQGRSQPDLALLNHPQASVREALLPPHLSVQGKVASEAVDSKFEPLDTLLILADGKVVGAVQSIKANNDGTFTLTRIDGTTVTGVCTYRAEPISTPIPATGVPTSLDVVRASCPEHVGSSGVRINHGDSPVCSGIGKLGDNYVAWSVVQRGDNYVALAGVCTILSGEYHVDTTDRIKDALDQAIRDVTKCLRLRDSAVTTQTPVPNAKPDGTLATKPASVLEVRIDSMCISVNGVNIGCVKEVNFVDSYVISTVSGKHSGKIQVWTQLADIYPEVQRALASGCPEEQAIQMGRIIPVEDKDIIISVDGVPAGSVDSIDFKKGEVVSQQIGLMRGKIRFFRRGKT